VLTRSRHRRTKVLHSRHGGSADLTKPPAAARKGLALDPQFLWLHTLLTRVYLAQLRPREALAKAERRHLYFACKIWPWRTMRKPRGRNQIERHLS